MSKVATVAGLVVLLLSLPALTVGAQAATSSSSTLSASSGAPTSFLAALTAAPNVKTSASGDAFFWLTPNGTALRYVVVVSNVTNAFMAHIHVSPSMDILTWLSPVPSNATSGEEASCLAVLTGGPASSCQTLISGQFSGVLAQGTITAADMSGSKTCDGCDNVTLSQLMTDIQAGNAYVNVHTSQNPGGEIQGTIVPATAFIAPLSAAPSVKTSATGEAFLWTTTPNGTALQYTLVVSNVTNAFMAHIHVSPSMDILTWLSPVPSNATSGEEASCLAVLTGGPASSCQTLISGQFSGVLAQGTITAADMSGSKTCDGCDNVTLSQLMTDIQAGNAYVNVHTSQNPGGEIQGTIVPLASATTPVPEFNTTALLAVLLVSMVAIVALSRRRPLAPRLHT